MNIEANQPTNQLVKKQWGIGLELIVIENGIISHNKHTYVPKEHAVPHPGVPSGTFALDQYHS